jgi:hypothetical protein
MRPVLLVVGLVVAGSAAAFLLRPEEPAPVDFADSLTGPTSFFDIPFDKYVLTPEGLLRLQSATGRSNGADRPVVRTRSDDYLSRDFVFEVDLTIPANTEDIAFVGVGDSANTAPYNEPGGAIGFRIHHMPTNREVRLAAVTLPPADMPVTYAFEQPIGIVPENGRVTVRLERAGDHIIASLPGQAGSEHTLRMSEFSSILRSGRGFLYLANTAEGTVFSNVRVRPRT